MPRLLLIASVLSLLLFRVGGVEAQWVQTNGPGVGDGVNSLATIGNDVYAATDVGIYRSTDNGNSWYMPSPGIGGEAHYLYAVFGGLYAASYTSLLFSSDGGSTWVHRDAGIVNVAVMALASTGSMLFAGATDGGGFGDPGGAIYTSVDSGRNWKETDVGLGTNSPVYALIASANSVIAGTTYGGIVHSTNFGVSWTAAAGGKGTDIRALVGNGHVIFAGGGGGVLVSKDDGASWVVTTSGVPIGEANSLALKGTSVFAGSSFSGVYRSDDSGKTWISVGAGIPSGANVKAIALSGSGILAATDVGGCVFRTSDDGLTWLPSIRGMQNSYVTTLVVHGTTLLTVDGYGGVAFRSTDFGVRWDTISASCNTLYLDSGTIYSGTKQISRTTDDGNSWTALNTGLPLMDYLTFCRLGSNLFAGTNVESDGSGAVCRSTDDGLTWSAWYNHVPSGQIGTLVPFGTDLFASVNSGGILRSTDMGNTWTSATSGFGSVQLVPIGSIGNDVFAGATGYYGVFRSTDSGMSWTPAGPWNDTPQVYREISTFISVGNNLFAGGTGVFLSTNRGATWVEVDSGLPLTDSAPEVSILAINGTDLYAGTPGHGVWRRALSEMIATNRVTSDARKESGLLSFPNPIFTSSSIRFSTVETGLCEITIHNLLGTEVTRLFTGELGAGEHSFTWDARGLPPGMYECVVRMTGHVERVPMILER